MRFFIVVFVSFFAMAASHAHQYIQCSDNSSFDRYVINLNNEQSTFFYTNGVHLPNDEQINFLTDLFVDSKNETQDIFFANIPSGKIVILIPSIELGHASSYFEVEYQFFNHEQQLSSKQKVGCFSSIHN